ncbi:MAG: hypothetical protein V8Q30_07265 [Acutalibacteraceae bacterium]
MFRYDIQYFLICPNCGKTYELSREDGRAGWNASLTSPCRRTI